MKFNGQSLLEVDFPELLDGAYELKCVAKIHDIGFRADAKLEIRESKGSGPHSALQAWNRIDVEGYRSLEGR